MSDFFVVAELFTLYSTFKNNHTEWFLTLYWGIRKAKTLFKVFGVWFLGACGTVAACGNVACDVIDVLFSMLPSKWLTFPSIGWLLLGKWNVDLVPIFGHIQSSYTMVVEHCYDMSDKLTVSQKSMLTMFR